MSSPALWDSWEDDAFLHDKERGIYYDVGKLHFLHHKGKFFDVRGPLNVSRSPQGRPVVAQAGSSETGRELAAKTADVVFTAQTELADARDFYADVKGRTARYGRTPDDVKIMPGITPVIGRTQAEARKNTTSCNRCCPTIWHWNRWRGSAAGSICGNFRWTDRCPICRRPTRPRRGSN